MKLWGRAAALTFDVYAIFQSYICIQAAVYQFTAIENLNSGYFIRFHFSFTGAVLCLFVLSLLAFSVCLTVSAYRCTGSRRSALWLLCWFVFDIAFFMILSPQSLAVAGYSLCTFSKLPVELYTILSFLLYVLNHAAVAVWLTDRVAASGPPMKRAGNLLCIVGFAGVAAVAVRVIITILTVCLAAPDSPSIGIIGGGDGPTATYLINTLIVKLFGSSLYGRLLLVFSVLLITGFVLRIRARRYPLDNGKRQL